MFNALLTKPTKKIGFNNLIVKIAEEAKNLFFIYYNEIVSFTYSGSASFLTNRIRFSTSTGAGSAITSKSYNIGKYTKLVIYWDGIIQTGGACNFAVTNSAGSSIAFLERTSNFTTTIKESISLTQSSIRNHAEFPNFKFSVYFTGDGASANSSGNVYEFYLE